MKKTKIISFLTSAVMAAGCIGGGLSGLTGNINLVNEPLTAEAATYGDETQYGDYLYYQTVDEDGDGTYDSVQISDCSSSAVSVEIPSEIDGLPVTSIGDMAFFDCKNLKSITIADSVTRIGRYAFLGTALLNNQTGTLKYADKWIIECDKNVTSVEIKAETEGIAERAFEDCTSLASITITGSVTSIGYHAFYECTSLENINVSGNNEFYTDIDGVLFNKDQTELLIYPAGKTDKEYVVPDSVTSIGEGAFVNLSARTNIIIVNPDCEIYDSKYTINSSYGTIVGYENSTAQAYAEKYDKYFANIEFIKENHPKIYLSSCEGEAGDTVIMQIFINCDHFFNGINSHLTWEDVKLVSSEAYGSNGNECISVAGEGYCNAVTYYLYSYQTAGAIASIDFTIPEDAEAGTIYEIQIEDCTNYPLTLVEGGTITVIESESEQGEENSNSTITAVGEYKYTLGYEDRIKLEFDPSEKCEYYITSECGGKNHLIKFSNDEGTSYGTSSSTGINSDVLNPDEYRYITLSSLKEDCMEEYYNWSEGDEETVVLKIYKMVNKSYNLSELDTLETFYCQPYTRVSIALNVDDDKYVYVENDNNIYATYWINNTWDSTGLYFLEKGMATLLITNEEEYSLDIVTDLETYTADKDWNDYLKYEKDIDGDSIKITGCKSYVNSVYVPSKIDGLPVTFIDVFTFSACKALSSITIPDSVTSIGGFAFESCTSLENITISDSVTSIGDCAFDGCLNLESITIENPKCEIYNSSDTISDTATIYGYENSTAQSYAEKYNREFVALDDDPVTTTPVVTTAVTPTKTTVNTTVTTSVSTVKTTSKTSTSTVTTSVTTAVTSTKTTVNTTVTVPVTTAAPAQKTVNTDILDYKENGGKIIIINCDELVVNVVVPETIDGKEVSKVSEYAFSSENIE
ncbi:MAG: leucine-rich repeat domain-containing protein, partial [Porcipelethomonas sp.]